MCQPCPASTVSSRSSSRCLQIDSASCYSLRSSPLGQSPYSAWKCASGPSLRTVRTRLAACLSTVDLLAACLCCQRLARAADDSLGAPACAGLAGLGATWGRTSMRLETAGHILWFLLVFVEPPVPGTLATTDMLQRPSVEDANGLFRYQHLAEVACLCLCTVR